MGRGRRIKKIEPSITSANGVWTINETFNYIQKNKWPGRILVEYLVVAGGGAGGSNIGGGGGGGGVAFGSMPLIVEASYNLSVGQGGSPEPSGRNQWDQGRGTSGQNSFFYTIVRGGGGAGGSGNDGATNERSGLISSNGGGSGGNGRPPIGSLGQNGIGSSGSGVNGTTNSITGASISYGVAGTGGTTTLGGPDNPSSGSNGINNTGNGGGGGHFYDGLGGSGGSGVIIISYQGPLLTNISASLNYTLDTTSRPGLKIYRFTAGSGSITV